MKRKINTGDVYDAYFLTDTTTDTMAVAVGKGSVTFYDAAWAATTPKI